jgi:putative peptidoglycan lipid II flippase
MAFKITDLMFNLLIGGAISAALIPALSGYIARKDEEDGWKTIGTFINTILMIMAGISILGVIFSPQIVNVLAPGFSSASKELTVSLIRILFPSVSFIMLAGLLNGVLNSYQRFAAAAYGPIVYNLGSIASILFLYRYGVQFAAFGVMCSAIIYFLFQLSFAWKNLKYFRFKLFIHHSGVKGLFKLAIPSLLASSIIQVNVIISASFASGFALGSIALLTNANDTWQLPYGIFAGSVAIAILPMLSHKYAMGDIVDFRNIISKGLRNVLMINIPAMVAFVVLAQPIISVIYKWSDKVNVNATGYVLMFYSLALITQSILAVISRAFYAVNDTKTPLYMGICTIIINVSLCVIFNNTTTLGVSGIALAFSLSSAFNAFSLLFILSRKKGLFSLRSLKSFLIKVCIASLVMGIVLFTTDKFVPVDFAAKFSSSQKLKEVTFLIIEIVSGLLIYFGIAYALRLDEAKNILNIAVKKLSKIKK